MVKEKNIAVSLLLMIVTCGIYGIIWFINLTDDVRTISGDNRLSGGKALLFTILTCGIYYYYWSYQMGKSIYNANVKYGKTSEDNSVLYLILTILGLGVVNYCLIQSELNNFSSVSKLEG